MTIQPIPRIVIRGEQKRKFLWYQVIAKLEHERRSYVAPHGGLHSCERFMEAYWPVAADLASTSILQSLMGSPPVAALYRTVTQGLVIVTNV